MKWQFKGGSVLLLVSCVVLFVTQQGEAKKLASSKALLSPPMALADEELVYEDPSATANYIPYPDALGIQMQDGHPSLNPQIKAIAEEIKKVDLYKGDSDGESFNARYEDSVKRLVTQLSQYSDESSPDGQYVANRVATMIHNSMEDVGSLSVIAKNPRSPEERKALEVQISRNVHLLETLKEGLGDQFQKNLDLLQEKARFVDLDCMERIVHEQNAKGSVAFGAANACYERTLKDQIESNAELKRLLGPIATPSVNGTKTTKVVPGATSDLGKKGIAQCEIHKLQKLMETLKRKPRDIADYKKNNNFHHWSEPVEGIGSCERISVTWTYGAEGLIIKGVAVRFPGLENETSLSESDMKALITNLKKSGASMANSTKPMDSRFPSSGLQIYAQEQSHLDSNAK